MISALRIIIFVAVMGTVSSGLLVGVNGFTSERIKKNEELKLKSAVLDALEIPYEKETASGLFDAKVRVLEKDAQEFYRGPDNAVAFEFQGPGLWGPIKGIVSVNPDLKTLRILKILHQEETPGLGARIAEKEFLGQFRNKEFVPKLLFVPQGKVKANNEVDAITGATGTIRALEKLLNETIQKNIGILKG
jgi:Na+-transporting NADH:ubiquinone oxidoreductase subunit C